MAAIAVNPLFMKDALFKVANDSYEAAISSAAFTPSTTSASWKGLTSASSHTRASKATWVCDLAYVQDWSTAGSLSRYLHDHEGQTVEVVFEPVAGGPSVTADIIIAPGAIGGAVDSFGTATVSLGVDGKPVIEAASAS